jgi:nucleoside-diphosphate kinase
MEKTLLLVKPSAIQRGLIGELISRIERKGLRIAGIKMMQLTEEIINEHYAHLLQKPFFPAIKKSMTATPIIAVCVEGVGAVDVIRMLTGATNGRTAVPGTIRGDFAMSVMENIVHTSDSPKTAAIEVIRFFKPEEIFDYKLTNFDYIYAEEDL